MNLTEAEIAYLKRFEFETWFNLHGPGTVYAECHAMAPERERADYLGDLAELATPTIQYQVIGDVQFETDSTQLIEKYPKVPFPWESLEALHQRVLELDPLSQPHELGGDVPVSGAESALAGNGTPPAFRKPTPWTP